MLLTDWLIYKSDDVMQQLYIFRWKVFISDNGNNCELKLDNSEGGRKLKVGFRVNGEHQLGVGGI